MDNIVVRSRPRASRASSWLVDVSLTPTNGEQLSLREVIRYYFSCWVNRISQIDLHPGGFLVTEKVFHQEASNVLQPFGRPITVFGEVWKELLDANTS